METHPKYIAVAVAFLLLLTGLIGGIVWLRKSGSDKDLHFYAIFFRRQSLAGLQEGSIVTMRGIPVGNVRSLEFNSESSEQIKVTVAVKKTAPVKVDSQAVIQRNLVTGLSMIDLTSGGKESSLLKPEYREPGILREGAGEFESLRTTGPELLQRSADILNKLQLILSDENRGSISTILRNVEQASSDLPRKQQELDRVLTEASKLLADARLLMTSLTRTSDRLSSAMTQLAADLGQTARGVNESMARAARSVSSATQRLENPRSLITGPSPAELGPGEAAP